MNVTNPELVLVRGINEDWFNENFGQMWIGFGGETPQTRPREDAYYVGLYLRAPVSKITHIGLVDRIDRKQDGGVDFYLKALIKLAKPVDPGHPIRKHENWTLSQLGLTVQQMDSIRILMGAI